MFFVQPDQIIYVRNISVLEVDCYLSSPNWWECMKLLEMVWNWIISLITFSINLLSMFNNTIEQKDLGESYNDLFGLGIIINVNDLKYKG